MRKILSWILSSNSLSGSGRFVYFLLDSISQGDFEVHSNGSVKVPTNFRIRSRLSIYLFWKKSTERTYNRKFVICGSSTRLQPCPRKRHFERFSSISSFVAAKPVKFYLTTSLFFTSIYQKRRKIFSNFPKKKIKNLIQIEAMTGIFNVLWCPSNFCAVKIKVNQHKILIIDYMNNNHFWLHKLKFLWWIWWKIYLFSSSSCCFANCMFDVGSFF